MQVRTTSGVLGVVKHKVQSRSIRMESMIDSFASVVEFRKCQYVSIVIDRDVGTDAVPHLGNEFPVERM